MIVAKKSLGQNFLTDKSVVQNIVSHVLSLFPENVSKKVHEIGPGTGALTQPLLEHSCQVLSIEKDARAIPVLNEKLGKLFPSSFSLIHEDILKWDPSQSAMTRERGNEDAGPVSPVVCVGNIPYYITSDILLWFLKHRKYYSHGIFMVQNEVADRLIAREKTKAYGRLTVKMQLCFRIQKLFMVPAACFTPRPQVDSAIVLLSPTDFLFSSEDEESRFESYTTTLFSARRKMLRRALHHYLERCDAQQKAFFWSQLNQWGVFEETRPDAICVEHILKIFRLMHNDGAVSVL